MAEQIEMITEKLLELASDRASLRLAMALGALGTAAVSPVLAQDEPGTVTVDVARCLELESEEARLACFGSEVDEVLGERGQPSPAGPRRASAAAPAEPARQPPGSENRASSEAESENATSERNDTSARLAEPDLSRRERRALREAERAAASAARDDDAGTDEFFGTIVGLRERLPNAYVIRLDNGQIWEQTEPKQYSLRPGLEVRIYPTRWGSRHRLTGVDVGGHIQVRRVE